MFWTPAFAGVTLQETFYEIIKVDSKTYCEKIKRKRFPTITQKIPTKTSSPLAGEIKVGEGSSFHRLRVARPQWRIR
jgi:hypothetical protein